MPLFLVILAAIILSACTSYKSAEVWRRGACNDLADVDERAQCLEEATRPESEYKQDREESSGY